MGFLSKFFSKEIPLAPADLSILKADLHSHFIPGIDDGSKSLEESLQLLTEFQNLGYKKVITTPHVMSDYYKNTPHIILNGLKELKEAALSAGLTIEVEAAAEYYLDFEFDKLIESKALLTFGENYVLFELPFISAPQNLFSTIFKLQTHGYKPVLAHPERYTYWHHELHKYQELKEKNVLFQLNINSLSGHYSPETKKMAERLIELGMIDLVGSDCHNMNHVGLLKRTLHEKYLHKVLQSGKLLNSKI